MRKHVQTVVLTFTGAIYKSPEQVSDAFDTHVVIGTGDTCLGGAHHCLANRIPHILVVVVAGAAVVGYQKRPKVVAITSSARCVCIAIAGMTGVVAGLAVVERVVVVGDRALGLPVPDVDCPGIGH